VPCNVRSQKIFELPVELCLFISKDILIGPELVLLYFRPES